MVAGEGHAAAGGRFVGPIAGRERGGGLHHIIGAIRSGVTGSRLGPGDAERARSVNHAGQGGEAGGVAATAQEVFDSVGHAVVVVVLVHRLGAGAVGGGPGGVGSGHWPGRHADIADVVDPGIDGMASGAIEPKSQVA